MAKKRKTQERIESLYSLLSACALAAITDAHVNEDWKTSKTVFSETFLNRDLPESVLRCAVLLGAEPKPPKGDVQFDDFTVSTEYWTQFVARLRHSVDQFRSELMETAGAKVTDFRTPHPFETIDRFCTKNRLQHSTTFIKLVAPQSDGMVCMTTQRRVLRLMQVPDRMRPPNRSQRVFAELLRKTMAAHDPKRYGNLLLDDLLWLPKPEPSISK